MTRLESLKSTFNLMSVAHLLGFKTKALAYILYKLPDSAKYSVFTIPKRSGGVRTIHAPAPELKNLQRRLSTLLQDCVADINAERGVSTAIAHGFRRRCSIITNASTHKHKRFVFNIDLNDFFGTINFGRVRGFFISNRSFALDPDVATILAQIACFENALPQGAPSSPVISNLIGHILDIRLAALAAANGCDYSRYADDLTFSTNKLKFPKEIARFDSLTQNWVPGKKLEKEVTRAGFSINPNKTRLQLRQSRQDVTGLVVNAKVNVRSEYYRVARSKCNSLFRTDGFYSTRWERDPNGNLVEIEEPGTLDQLHGVLSFIDNVKQEERDKDEKLKPREFKGFSKLYSRFLLYRHIYAAKKPLIICEGKTDNVYIRAAIKSLHKKYKKLAKVEKKKVELKIDLFRYTETAGRFLHLSGGTGSFNEFIQNYKRERNKFKATGETSPVIFLVDNDDGATCVLQAVKQFTKKAVSKNEAFYYLGANLYVVLTPRTSADGNTMIEDFFDQTVKATKLGGKSFNPHTPFDQNKHYGKFLFAEHVLKKNQANIDFEGFEPVLDRIVAAIKDHNKMVKARPPSVAASNP